MFFFFLVSIETFETQDYKVSNEFWNKANAKQMTDTKLDLFWMQEAKGDQIVHQKKIYYDDAHGYESLYQ